jgi:hypothetical protein
VAQCLPSMRGAEFDPSTKKEEEKKKKTNGSDLNDT